MDGGCEWKLQQKNNDILGATVSWTACWRGLKQNSHPCDTFRAFGAALPALGKAGAALEEEARRSGLFLGQFVPSHRHDERPFAPDKAAVAGLGPCPRPGASQRCAGKRRWVQKRTKRRRGRVVRAVFPRLSPHKLRDSARGGGQRREAARARRRAGPSAQLLGRGARAL